MKTDGNRFSLNDIRGHRVTVPDMREMGADFLGLEQGIVMPGLFQVFIKES